MFELLCLLKREVNTVGSKSMALNTMYSLSSCYPKVEGLRMSPECFVLLAVCGITAVLKLLKVLEFNV